jgi:hypothetical protein
MSQYPRINFALEILSVITDDPTTSAVQLVLRKSANPGRSSPDNGGTEGVGLTLELGDGLTDAIGDALPVIDGTATTLAEGDTCTLGEGVRLTIKEGEGLTLALAPTLAVGLTLALGLALLATDTTTRFPTTGDSPVITYS